MSKTTQFFLSRLDERSTWRGLVFILTSLGISLDPGQTEAILSIGIAIGGLVEMFLPDPGGRISTADHVRMPVPTDHPESQSNRGPFDVI